MSRISLQENLIQRLNWVGIMIYSDIMIYVDDYGIEKDKAYIIQLLVVMGKFHMHKMKWSGGKANFFIFFINELKQYCNLVYTFMM